MDERIYKFVNKRYGVVYEGVTKQELEVLNAL